MDVGGVGGGVVHCWCVVCVGRLMVVDILLESYVLATCKVISGGYRIVTVHTHGGFIMLSHWETDHHD